MTMTRPTAEDAIDAADLLDGPPAEDAALTVREMLDHAVEMSMQAFDRTFPIHAVALSRHRHEFELAVRERLAQTFTIVAERIRET
jgi:hypothetical protein